MNYKIEYEEIIRKINSVTIEVEDEQEGEGIANMLFDLASEFDHPGDIFHELSEMGIKVLETCKGSEECEYVIQ